MQGEQGNDSQHQNWCKAIRALMFGKEAIETYVQNKIVEFRDSVLEGWPNKSCSQCTIANLTPCRTRRVCRGPPGQCDYHDSNDPLKLSRPTCPNGVCNKLYKSIIKEHNLTPLWENTDSTKWCENPWTIAKCFMPKGYAKSSIITEIDFTGLLSVFINANFMKKDRETQSYTIYEKVMLFFIYILQCFLGGSHFVGFKLHVHVLKRKNS